MKNKLKRPGCKMTGPLALLLALFIFSSILSFTPPFWSQGKVEDYDRSFALREKFEGQAINIPDRRSGSKKRLVSGIGKQCRVVSSIYSG